MFNDLGRLGKYLGQAARLMVGMPDYDNYVEHMQKTHPDKPVMSYEAFFRERQEARYGGKSGPSAVEPAVRVNLWEPG
ncbi:YbdD/YjiX family protein [Pseudomonas sp. 13.2]|uniref:YbdD/YjiX family protein n=1 Tax=Pseudomonas sp. 13.2 TaxID=3144665 RepID=A0AAU7BL42_9PSED